MPKPKHAYSTVSSPKLRRASACSPVFSQARGGPFLQLNVAPLNSLIHSAAFGREGVVEEFSV